MPSGAVGEPEIGSAASADERACHGFSDLFERD